MASSDFEVVVVGGGAAGVAAAKALHRAGVRCLLVEARDRLGGRAWTVKDPNGFAIDLGCGWLHSADRNPWARVAEEEGVTIDKSAPPWTRPALAKGFPPAEQAEFQRAAGALFERMEAAAQGDKDVAAANLLEPEGRWNAMINTVGTFISGADLDWLSVKDFDRYADSGVNWRVVEGYGTLISGYGADLPVRLGCPVRGIDHRGRRLRVATDHGDIAVDHAIVTVPTTVLAEGRITFTPELPRKIQAAHDLPLGLADKLFIALDGAEEFDPDVRLFARTDRSGTGGYHLRPFGRPQIEAYFGGRRAAELEKGGEAAFFEFAADELAGLFGADFRRRIRPIRVHGWGADPFARGSYSSALPGFADQRAVLAEPVDGRIFFAGEACSRNDFSTAHGGWLTGVAAATEIIGAREADAALTENSAR
jgi:monoamine oxidase